MALRITSVTVGDERYEYDLVNPSNREAMAIERAFDGTYWEWVAAARSGSAQALTCLVYVLRKRNDPTVRFDEVEFNINDVDLVLEGEEDDDEDGGDPKADEGEAPSSTGTEPGA